MGEYTDPNTSCRVATFTSNPDPDLDALLADTPENREKMRILDINFCAEESEKDIQTPFAIGDDFLYVLPDVFYVERLRFPHSPTILINIHHAVTGYHEKYFGDMVWLYYTDKDATGDLHQYSPFIIYTPLEDRFVSAKSLRGCFNSEEKLDVDSAEVKQHKEIFGQFAPAHPLGKIITTLYDYPAMLDSLKPEILQHAGKQIEKNEELQRRLAKLTGPETFDPKYPPGPLWETEEKRDELVRKTISALNRMKV